jgi:phenylacetate-CoA ligase
MIWNKSRECLSRDEMRSLQDGMLKELVERVYYNVPFYREKMQMAGLQPDDIKGMDDLHRLPFTTKQDLRDNYPFGLFAVPMTEIIRLHASSGTTGKPTVVGYTRKDLNTWSEVVARTMTCAGIGKKDIIQIAYGYGLFTGGLGIHYGAEKIGAVVIPVSGGNTKRQLQLLQDFGSTAIACTPSYALFLAEAIEEFGMKPEDLHLRVGIFGAEPWTENMRKEIEAKLHIKAIDIYGLSEVIGPGVASECMEQKGLHINEDHFIPEIIDPLSLEVLPEGEKGELVFTTVSKEGLPLIRYRTRDLTRLNYASCECGRTLVRMEKCTGRSDDMLIIRGVNLFPSQIESVLLEMSETKPHYMIMVDRVNNLDSLQVEVEVDEQFFLDKISQLQKLRQKIQSNLESALGLSVDVKLVEPKTIQRSEGKAVRVIDNRKIE